MAHATEQELDIVGKQLQGLREEIMRQAVSGAVAAGFADRHARFIAVQAVLLGAAQLYAMTFHGSLGLFEVHKSMCAVMATADPKQIVARNFSLGDEAAAGGLILPSGYTPEKKI